MASMPDLRYKRLPPFLLLEGALTYAAAISLRELITVDGKI